MYQNIVLDLIIILEIKSLFMNEYFILFHCNKVFKLCMKKELNFRVFGSV